MIIVYDGNILTAPCQDYIILSDYEMNDEEYEDRNNEYACKHSKPVNSRRKYSYNVITPNDKLSYNGCVCYTPSDEGRTIIQLYSIDVPRKVKSEKREKRIDIDLLKSQLSYIKEYMKKNNKRIAIYDRAGRYFKLNKKSLSDILSDIFDDDNSTTVYLCTKDIRKSSL